MSKNSRRLRRHAVTVYLAPARHAELTALARQAGVSMSHFVNRLIEQEADRQAKHMRQALRALADAEMP